MNSAKHEVRDENVNELPNGLKNPDGTNHSAVEARGLGLFFRYQAAVVARRGSCRLP
jgi:hypothetical protein